MESFGRYLRAEREAREVSIEDLSRVTKINRHILQSIEADEFAKLPPPVFVRGFVRTISKTLGTSPEEMVRRYDDYVATHGPQAVVPGAAAPSPEQAVPAPLGQGMPAPQQSFGRVPFFAGLALLVIALAVGYRLASRRGGHAASERSKGKPSATAPAGDASAVAGSEPAAAIPEEGRSAATEPSAGTAALPPPAKPAQEPGSRAAAPEAGKGSPALAPPSAQPALAAAEAAAGSHTVFLKAKGACWVQLTSDAEPPKEYILQLNETVSQKYDKTLTLRVGNPVNLTFDWEGRHYEVLATQARPMRWDFPLNAAAIEKLDAANAPPGAPPPALKKPAPPPSPRAAVPAAGTSPVQPASAVPTPAPAPASPAAPAPAAAPSASGATAPGSSNEAH